LQVDEEESKKIQEPSIKLTEDIQKPTGIGSFGFAAEKNTTEKSETTENGNTTTSKNFFAQNINSKDKIGFIFGSSGSSAATITGGGFSALKEDNNTKSSNKNDTATTPTETETDNSDHETLLTKATEYEKSHNTRQRYEEVEQFTGEEGEQHVLQVHLLFKYYTKLSGVLYVYLLVHSLLNCFIAG